MNGTPSARVEAPAPSPPSKRAAARVGVPQARRFALGATRVPIEWIPGEYQASLTIAVFSILLPAGEDWFVRVFREALPELKDHPCAAALRGFLAQESNHARAHADMTKLLEAEGLDLGPLLRAVEYLFDHALEKQPFGRKLPRFLERPWLVRRLAIIAAIEHFTSMLGQWILENHALDDAGADRATMDLLRWHGAEEVEHRTTAFEAYHAMGGSYVGRVIAMTGVTPVFFGFLIAGTEFLTREVREKTGEGPKHAAFGRYFEASRRDIVPRIPWMLRAIGRYYERYHHPSSAGDDAMAEAYLAKARGVT